MSEKRSQKIGSAIVVGGGIGGMQTALDLAESGIKVYLVEAASAIGGRMTQLDKTFPTNECAMCVVSPKLVECGRHLNIDIITDSEIERIEGEAGNFEITLYKRARFVDMEKCTGCEECAMVCPVEVPSKFDSYIGKHRAAYRMYPQAVPRTFVIDKRERGTCVIKCPAHVNAQGYIALVSQGKYKEAFDLIRNCVPFPGVLSRVCYHPCEPDCNRKDIESPIAINPLKRFVTDFVYKKKKSTLFPEGQDKEKKNADKEKTIEVKDRPYSFDLDITEELVKIRKGNKVAIVGAGPCGLTAAHDLTRLGYTATIFEAEDQLGGMLAFGIPSYRLPKDIMKLEIDAILKMGIEVKKEMSLGKDFTLSDLKRDGYKAVLLATGAGKGRELDIPGSKLKGVWQGVDFLKKINLGEDVGIEGKVLVIGGGNVAIDVARSAIRLGAGEVDVVCLESFEEMPAHRWEIKLAEQEGVVIRPSWGPVEILGKNNNITGVKFLKCLSVFDKSNRFNPVFNEEEECTIKANHVVLAVGQQPNTPYLKKGDEIERTDFGGVKTDPLTCTATEKGVFAGGDVSSGPASLIEAIAAGKEAAISIDRYIRGEDLSEGRERIEKSASAPEMKFELQERVEIPLLTAGERKGNFNEVELALSEEDALREANRCLNCGICSECLECEKVCEPCAIVHNMKDERLTIKTGAIIIATGVGLFDASIKKEYGFNRYDNVISNIQFERILSSSGPTAGEVVRPSDSKRPKRIAFIQCVGSRDPSCGNEFCSYICCMASVKEAIIAKEHDPEIEPTVFYIDLRSFGKNYERYYEDAKDNYGVRFIHCMISKIYERPQSKNLVVKYIDETGRMQKAEFDLVVLAVGLTSTDELKPLAERLGVDVNEYGFLRTERHKPNLTSRDGIFVAGTYAGPKDIAETVTEGSSAGSLVSALLKDVRGTLVQKKEYPPERNILDEDLRIGVFVCRCGRNIGAVVNVPEVVRYASKLKDVACAEEFLYTCSKDALDIIKQRVMEHNLNRVVVASCTPRTHEELFRDTVRETGLNRYLFEMASLREQVSWVHKDDPEKATEKSKELVNMMVAKIRLTKPLAGEFSNVIPSALVVGGGAAGMHSALSAAKQGFEVYLVEKENSLGGHLRELFYNPEEEDPQNFLKSLTEKLGTNEKIHVMTNSTVKSMSGFIGNYHSVIDCDGKEKEIEHGAVIVATGAKAYEPKSREYGYGESAGVMTQVKLEEKLTKNPKYFSNPQTFVMIQCVGSRNDEHPYCSRICCLHAVKNALRLKEINPEHKIIVLYRDIRTYGFLEKHYLKAREAGVVFSCFDAEKEPRVRVENNKIYVNHLDKLLKEEIGFQPDWLLLSTGIIPGDNEILAKTLKVPLNADGFFMEAHAKIRPLDFTTEGIFFCGLANSPNFLHESLIQAQGAAMRAATILSKERIETKAITVEVNERLCKGCGVCVTVCPFEAREIDKETQTAKVIEVLCQGCGACAVACPSGATTHKGFTKKQIMSMAEAALK